MIKITPKEKKAIADLQKLADTWPTSLWLFSASGRLWVMKKKNGETVMLPFVGSGMGKGGGVDPKYSVAKITGIENDGGDW